MERPRTSEKVEQANIVRLLRTLGASVYTLGTRRPRGDHPGTRQTPGLPDLYALLPAPRVRHGLPCAVWIEVQRHGGRLSPGQQQFRESCLMCGIAHIVGSCDAVIAWSTAGGWLTRRT
jgi:hypothetical protein